MTYQDQIRDNDNELLIYCLPPYQEKEKKNGKGLRKKPAKKPVIWVDFQMPCPVRQSSLTMQPITEEEAYSWKGKTKEFFMVYCNPLLMGHFYFIYVFLVLSVGDYENWSFYSTPVFRIAFPMAWFTSFIVVQYLLYAGFFYQSGRAHHEQGEVVDHVIEVEINKVLSGYLPPPLIQEVGEYLFEDKRQEVILYF